MGPARVFPVEKRGMVAQDCRSIYTAFIYKQPATRQTIRRGKKPQDTIWKTAGYISDHRSTILQTLNQEATFQYFNKFK